MGNKWDDVKVYVKRPEAPAGIAAAESLTALEAAMVTTNAKLAELEEWARGIALK